MPKQRMPSKGPEKSGPIFLFISNCTSTEYYYQYQLAGKAAMNGVVIHPAEPFEARITLEHKF